MLSEQNVAKGMAMRGYAKPSDAFVVVVWSLRSQSYAQRQIALTSLLAAVESGCW